MALSNKYKFYLQSSTLGTVEINPTRNELRYRFERNELSITKQKQIASDIILRNSEFNLIYQLEQNGQCEEVKFLIDTYCGGTWQRDFNGFVNLRKCEWDLHNCRVKLGIELDSPQRCIDEIYTGKINLLQKISAKYKITSLEGIVETTVCGFNTFTSIPPSLTQKNTLCLNPSEISTWSVIKNEYQNITFPTGGGLPSADIRTTWARQKVTSSTQPLGSGWVLIAANTWARQVSTTFDYENSTNDYALGGNSFTDIYKVYGLSDTSALIDYDNAMTLNDVLTALLNQNSCSYTIVSDFFNINADNTHPNNLAYTKSLDYHSLMIWQGSDVKRPNSTNNATVLNTNLDEFLRDLKALFNLEYSVYKIGSTNYFRLEHKSYYGNTNGTDLTTFEMLKGKLYTYKSDNLPVREDFFFNSLTDGVGKTFDYYPINYNSNCADKKTVIEFRANQVLTNMGFIYKNENYSDSTIVIAATYQNGGLRYISSDIELNDFMSWSKLIHNFYYYDRPFASGLIGGLNKVLEQRKTRSENVTIEIDSCNIATFDFNLNQKSLIDWGIVDSAEYDALNCVLDINLLV